MQMRHFKRVRREECNEQIFPILVIIQMRCFGVINQHLSHHCIDWQIFRLEFGNTLHRLLNPA